MTPLLIITACIGYFFCLNVYRFNYKIARSQNWHLFFMSMAAGILLLCFAIAIQYFLNQWSNIDLGCSSYDLLPCQINLTIISATSGFFIGWLLNSLYPIQDFIDNDLDKILYSSLSCSNKQVALQFTLDDRKSYVGWVIDGVEAKNDSAFVTILPIFSGYRDKDTLSLKLTVDYRRFYSELEDYQQLAVVLPKSKITICNYFNSKVYKQLGNR